MLRRNSPKWSREFRNYLLATFQYDKETGFITRRWQAAKGPRQVGALGTMHPSGSLMMNIVFQGRQYAVSCQKLAVFLETGMLFHKIVHRNGIKYDNRWVNLVPIENPVDEEGRILNYTQSEKEALKLHIQEFKAEQERKFLAEQQEKEKVKQEMLDRMNRSRKQQDSEPVVDYAENWRRLNEQETTIQLAIQNDPFMVAYRQVWEKYEMLHKQRRYLNGIHTKIPFDQAEVFLKDCIELDGVSAEQFYKENKEPGKLADAPKWIQDRFLVSKLVYWRDSGIAGEQHLQAALDTYVWEGQPYLKEFDMIEPALQVELETEIAQLELAFNTTKEKVEKKHREKYELKPTASIE